MATTYERPPDGPYHSGDAIYTREDNPTRLLLEQEVARLECHGSAFEATSWAFSSGMMAASAIILAHESPLQVMIHKDLYHGVSVSF